VGITGSSVRSTGFDARRISFRNAPESTVATATLAARSSCSRLARLNSRRFLIRLMIPLNMTTS
jgi:hypothetical protein